MSAPVRFERCRGVGVITVDNPPVNALSTGIPDGIMEHLRRGFDDPAIAALVLIGAGRTFIAGADIREFGKPRDPEAATLRDLIELLEGAAKPVVAAMHGNALGGGLEAALGCNYRVGSPGTRYGFPEVKIGLLPGAGGTQRAPRLIGVEPALEMIVSGDFVASQRALSLGLIDAELEGDLREDAIAFAERAAAERTSHPRIGSPPADRSKLSEGYFEDYRAKIAPRARGLFSPFLCIDCVEFATELPLPEGLQCERELFEQCLASPQSKALIHAFFAERAAAKVPGLPKGLAGRPIAKAGVVGAGTMGGGIAMCFANAGIPVHLVETSEEALAKGLATVHRNYERSVAKGRLSEEKMAERRDLMTSGLSLGELKDVDIVIEAVFEEMDIKIRIFEELDRVCKPGAVLATNTSSLDVNEIASATRRPEAVIGTHFFSPANVMRLLETVRGGKTSDETIAAVMALAKRIGKTGVLVGVCDGFVGNRMLYGYLREANFLIEEGAFPHQVDEALVEFGMAMGPFGINDLAGLDVGYRVRKRQAASRPKHLRYSKIGDTICEMGRHGQKTGKGWYRYEPGNRTPLRDPEIEALIVEESKALGIARREVGAEEIVERCIYPLINEGAKILEEGIALRASDIDVVWINGYGFPRWCGGPMFHADSVGLGKVYEAVCRYHESQGPYWEPAALLKRLAGEGKNFADLDASAASA
ncbi:MAG: 3-hydroxyacyl-CoA dehydrogenase NAD-binding domain-containing protein [Proteobacteria bacterium]|nr:3-hydroxyacyl-CoA dehydrogenase NAD-binding domain-containing protein [Pseudomonadota bacterium]